MTFFFIGLFIGGCINVVGYKLLRSKTIQSSHYNRLYSRYRLIVKLITGLLFFFLHNVYDHSPEFWGYAVFITIIILSSVIDIAAGVIPNHIIIAGLISGIFLGRIKCIVFYHIYGAMLGFLIFLVIYIFSKGGMGAGDVKFAAVLGSFLGVKLLLLSIIIAFLSGAAVGMWLILVTKKSMKSSIPFAPFMGLGAITSLLCGEGLIGIYMN
ncbi:MAG: prepilin peptidase [Tepidanaerobacteraceae bacterium]